MRQELQYLFADRRRRFLLSAEKLGNARIMF
jgi:hypothetical protein